MLQGVGESFLFCGSQSLFGAVSSFELNMSIVAVCPYCRVGRVRAPNDAIGASATCPNCTSCFTIVVSNDIMPAPAKPAIPHPTAGVVAAIRAEAKRAVVEPEELEEPCAADVEQPNELVEASKIPPRKLKIAEFIPPPAKTEGVEVSFVLAMIAMAFAGIGLVASQIPYGRYVAVGMTGLGLLIGLIAWATADRRWQLPVGGIVFNAVALVLATVLPGWLGLSAWRPPVAIVDDSTLIKVMPFDGGPARVAEDGWVDATQGAWQHGDLRVTLTAAWVAKINLVPAKDKPPGKEKPKPPKDKMLQIGLRLANVGPARRLEYGSWNQTPPAGASPVRLWQFSSTAELSPQTLLPATFEKGWDVEGRGVKSTLFPGMNGNDLLVFEAPSPQIEYLRLELPPWVFGNVADPAIETVRFQIPRSMIEFR
jgi:hypothetical protein